MQKVALVLVPENYFYHSAAFYTLQNEQSGFLIHYRGQGYRLHMSLGVTGHPERSVHHASAAYEALRH